jgi:hypothetical protein
LSVVKVSCREAAAKTLTVPVRDALEMAVVALDAVPLDDGVAVDPQAVTATAA